MLLPEAVHCSTLIHHTMQCLITPPPIPVPSVAKDTLEAAVSAWPEVWDVHMQLWVSLEIVCDFVTRDPVVDWRCSIPWQNHSERLVLGVRIQVGRKWQRKSCGQREFHSASVVASMPAAADVRV